MSAREKQLPSSPKPPDVSFTSERPNSGHAPSAQPARTASHQQQQPLLSADTTASAAQGPRSVSFADDAVVSSRSGSAPRLFSEESDLGDASSTDELDLDDPDGERSRVQSAIQKAQAIEGWAESMAGTFVGPPVASRQKSVRGVYGNAASAGEQGQAAFGGQSARPVDRKLQGQRPVSARPPPLSRASNAWSDDLSSNAAGRARPGSAPATVPKVTPKVPLQSSKKEETPVVSEQKELPVDLQDKNYIAMNLLKAREKRAAEAILAAQLAADAAKNLAPQAVAQARAVADTIAQAAAQYDPSLRPQSARSRSRGTSRSRPGSSAAAASAAANGSRLSRPQSASFNNNSNKNSSSIGNAATTKRSAAELWDIVRHAYQTKTILTTTTGGNPNAVMGVKNAQPIPYSMSLRHGFQYRYSLRYRQQQVLWAGCHVKVPIHFADGRVPVSEADDARRDRKADDWASNAPLSSYTFVTIDRTRTATIWDVAANGSLLGSHKPRAIVKCPMEVEQMAFVSKLCVYVGVGCGRGLKFFNSRLELLQICRTQEPVLFVKYNKTAGELVTAGSHDICVWKLDGVKLRRRHHFGFRITATLKHSYTTELPRDEWISEIYVDEYTSRVFSVVGTKILVHDLHYFACLPPLRNISTRHVKTLIQHDLYQYTIIGFADGSIQIRNMAHAIIHEFNSHTQSITALALYPHGHVLVSAAMDSTIRMFDLKTFNEVYCLHLRDKPLGLSIIDDQLLYIRASYGVQVWSLNHVNASFANTSSKVSTLFRAKSPNYPARIITRTEDGVIRLLSPVSGKPVTTALPLLETDGVLNNFYRKTCTDRMYLMLESGEIWVVATNANPCIVVDIWRMTESAREDVDHIEIFDGRFSPSDEMPSGYDRASGFAVLLGTTRNGQVLVYGKRGGVGDRSQLHNSEITQILCDEKQQLLFTCGADEMIKISTVVPTANATALLHQKIAISTHMVPKTLAVAHGVVCASSDDFAIQMYSFDIKTKDWQMLPSHNRSDDHTDHVTTICPIRKFRLFVSCSRDGSIRVWDSNNVLLREIQFTEPLKHICVGSSYGNLLFGFQNRLDLIKYMSYLPPTYAQAAQKLDTKVPKAEAPVPFDDIRTNWTSLQYRAPKKLAMTAHGDQWKLFQDVNLVGTERPQDAATTFGDEKDETEEIDAEEAQYEQLMVRINAMALQRQQFVEAARRKMEAEKADAARQEEIMHEQVRNFNMMNRFRGHSGTLFEDGEIPIDFRPTSPDPVIVAYSTAADDGEVASNDESGDDDGSHDDYGSMSGPNGLVIAAEIMAEYTKELAAKKQAAGTQEIALNAEAVTADEADKDKKARRRKSKRRLHKEPQSTAVASDAEELLDQLSATDYAAYERKQRAMRIRMRELKRLESLGQGPVDPNAAATEKAELVRPASPQVKRYRPASEASARIPAPDGVLPNSFVQQDVSEWKKTHTGFHIEDLAVKVTSRAPKVEDVGASEDSNRRQRSEDYKAKLKEMMERMPVEPEPEPAPEGEEAVDAPDPASPGQAEVEAPQEAPRARLPPVRKMKVEALAPREPVKKVPPKIVLPPTIQKLAAYDWCPMDEIFNPPEATPEPISKLGRRASVRLSTRRTSVAAPPKDLNRTVKLERTDAGALLPVVLNAFRSATSPKTRLEVVEYINWLNEQDPIPDFNNILKILCKHLVTPVGKETDAAMVEQELQLRCTVIESIAKFSPNHLDVVPALLVQTLSAHGQIRTRATQFLKALGVYAPENKFVTEAVREIVKEISPELSTELRSPESSRPSSARPSLSRPSSSSKLRERPALVAKTKVPAGTPPPDVKTAVTNFLKKSLKSYLIRATPNQEIRQHLKGMTIHGFEMKGKKPGAKQDGGSDSERGPKSALKQKGSRASSASTRPRSGGTPKDTKKKVVFDSNLTSTLEAAPHDERAPNASAVAAPPVAAVGLASAMRVAVPDFEMDMSMLMESITYRPSIPRIEDDSPTVIPSAGAPSFQQLLVHSVQQKQDIQRAASAQRSPITILQNPTTADYVSGLNFYMLDLQHKELKAEQEAIAAVQRQQELAMERAREEEKRRLKAEAFVRKEKERVEKLEARKKQIQEAKKDKKALAEEPSVEKKGRTAAEMQTKGIGLTHRSTCHPSRETLDYDQSKFPPLGAHVHGRGGLYADLTMHIGKYNRSMPMERVSLLPFDGAGQAGGSSSSIYSSRNLKPAFSASRPPTSVPLGSPLSPAQLAPTWQEFSVDDLTVEVLERELIGVVPGAELRYIRSAGIGRRKKNGHKDSMFNESGDGRESGAEEERKFRTQRKYFIPALSVALETVAAGQTLGIID
ncbi:hypothetical protein HDU86_004643 [Geranomyces michiganensis]|nr:hypothetical protein HDU86_004643 [Geranomyces michiganensis]